MKPIYLAFCLLVLVGTSTAQTGVAINTNGNTPHSSAMLDVQSTEKGFLLPRMTTAQMFGIPAPAAGLMVFNTSYNELYHYNGSSWRPVLNGNYWLRPLASRDVLSNTTDSIGIGVTLPAAKLHVHNGDLRVSNADLNIVNGDIVHNKAGATIQLQDAGANKGFFQLSGDDLRFGTNSGNSTGNVYLRMNGANRYQFTESGRMTIMAEQSPTLYFNTDNINKAYLQLQGESIKLDAPGNKVYVGDDLIVDDATNRVGIGTSSPEQKLHVTGSAKITGGKVLNNVNENLLPLAYAQFDINGNKVGGTSNMSGGWIGTMFKLNCTSDMTNAAIIITSRNARLIPTWVPSDVGTSVYLYFYDSDGDERGSVAFSVVIYKTT